MEASPGARGTTSRQDNFIGSRRITGFPTGCTDRSRTAARRVSPAGEKKDKTRGATGFRVVRGEAAVRFQIRRTRVGGKKPGPLGAWCGCPKQTGRCARVL